MGQMDPALRILNEIAVRRGCLKAGGIADPEKASRAVIDDFRAGRLGKITLEKI
jgi:ribosome biogenesis GTPase A